MFGKQKWVRAANVEDFPKRTRFVHKRKEYALFKLEDGVYCTQNSCSHEYSPLSDGEIYGENVYCPKHGSRFNIKTGAVVDLPATAPIKTFPVKVEEDGEIYVRVK